MTRGAVAVAALVAAAALPARAREAGWAEVRIERAYHLWAPPVFERLADARPAAIDVAVDLQPSMVGLFAPPELTIGDPRADDPGRAPVVIVRLTAAGEPADPHDPVFAGEPPHRMRLLVVGLVARSAREVALRYRGERFGPAATIERGGPIVPSVSHAVLAHAPAGRAPLDGHVRHRVLVEARNWPRVTTPDRLQLAYRLTDRDRVADVDHWIEVDAAGQPVTAALATRPLLVPVRRFVLEFWLIEGGRDLAVDHTGQRTPLRARPLVLSPPAETALARAQPNLDAAHYRAE